MSFTFLLLEDPADALPFYKKHRDKTRFSQGDQVFVLLDNDKGEASYVKTESRGKGGIIAALKLSKIQGVEQNSFFMRSVLVDSSYRRQGLASSLIHQTINAICEQHKDISVICFPFDHLHHLYARCGFELIPEKQLPNALLKSWQRYDNAIKAGRMSPVIMMQFSSISR